MRAVVALGSNIGDRFSYMQTAVNEINQLSETQIKDISNIYETTPVGYLDQPNFLNAVITLETNFSSEELLMKLLLIELNLGRERSILNGPRTIDLDLIDFEKSILKTEKLELPHPRAFERCFVLKPWLEIDSNAEILNKGSISELIKNLNCEDMKLFPKKLLNL